MFKWVLLLNQTFHQNNSKVTRKIMIFTVLSLPLCNQLTLNLLTTTIVAPPSNASKWQMGFNSAFKGLRNTNEWNRSKMGKENVWPSKRK
jgi:hypothetical protein